MAGCPQLEIEFVPGEQTPRLSPRICVQSFAPRNCRFERRGSGILAVLLGVASLGARNTGGKLESPEIRLCWVRNGVAPGAGARVPSPNTLRVFQAVFERKILELKTNVVRILNFESKTCRGQAYLKLSSYAKAQTAGVAAGRKAYSTSPCGF